MASVNPTDKSDIKSSDKSDIKSNDVDLNNSVVLGCFTNYTVVQTNNTQNYLLQTKYPYRCSRIVDNVEIMSKTSKNQNVTNKLYYLGNHRFIMFSEKKPDDVYLFDAEMLIRNEMITPLIRFNNENHDPITGVILKEQGYIVIGNEIFAAKTGDRVESPAMIELVFNAIKKTSE